MCAQTRTHTHVHKDLVKKICVTLIGLISSVKMFCLHNPIAFLNDILNQIPTFSSVSYTPLLSAVENNTHADTLKAAGVFSSGTESQSLPAEALWMAFPPSFF